MPKEPGEKRKLKERLQAAEGLWDFRREIFSGVLMIVGLILAFFYHYVGGILVGLSFGVYFFEEIHGYFSQLVNVITEHGFFKTLMIIGIVIFFLITLPLFIIATAVGYGAMYLIRLVVKKE